MASFTPPKNNTNLFGSTSSSLSSENASSYEAAGKRSSSNRSTRSTGGDFESALSPSSSSAAAAASSAWFEDDDETLLSQLLLQSDVYCDFNINSNNSISEYVNHSSSLNDKLDRMLLRFEEDISSSAAGFPFSRGGSGESGGGDANIIQEDAWWTNLIGVATSLGFTCTTTTSSSSDSGGSIKNHSSITLPKAFHTPEGRAHITALVDLLGISRERAVRITLASLRTFAMISNTTTTLENSRVSTTTTAVDNEEEGDTSATTTATAGVHSPSSPSPTQTVSSSSEHEAARLRSLLGTRELFRRVLHFHRQEFLLRLRILTECLRLEQESKGAEEGQENDNDNYGAIVEQNYDDGTDDASKKRRLGISRSCARLLDRLDARLVIIQGSTSSNNTNQLRRGIFQVLLKLATGPALPGLGGKELPYSVGKLRGGSSGGRDGLENLLSGSSEIVNAIRKESAEALLALLYDRIDGGVTRLDLFLIIEAASSSSSKSSSFGGAFEFGMTGRQYAKMRRRRGVGMDIRGGGGEKLDDTNGQQQSRCTMDGLWALICAECMGLWRTSSDGDNDWVNSHPFFWGITDANEQNRIAAQEELTVLRQKLLSLGETACDRRGLAYQELRGNLVGDSSMSAEDETDKYFDDDDALWGVQAPEGVALLSFGLLLHLASLVHPTHEFMIVVRGWGEECARMANDDCAAFSYLLCVLESTVQDPIIGNPVRKPYFGNDELVSNLLKRGVFEMVHEDSELTLSDSGRIFEEDYDVKSSLQHLVVADAASVIYASIGREILMGTIRAFRDSLLSLHVYSSAVENIGILSDLASAIYRNSSILCERFWSSWEMFCQRGGSDSLDRIDDSEVNDTEPMCCLLDASHSLAMLALAALKTRGSQQAAILYLKPLSSFLHLIASLCASPSMVRSILTSDFLPEGLLSSSMTVISALAPLMSSIDKSVGPVQAEARKTIRCATVFIESISIVAHMGGEDARAWIRRSLQNSVSTTPQIICRIAFESISHGTIGLGFTELTTSALNLLVDVLVGSDAAFQVEASYCFAASSALSIAWEGKMSGFASFAINGGDSRITLAAMRILNCLSINLARTAFNTSITSSGAATSYIETIGSGVMVALDLLSTFVLSSDVSFPTSKVQVATADAILASLVSTLVHLKQVGYLHEYEEVRSLSLIVRKDIIYALSSSTPLGQIVAFLATVTISTGIQRRTASSRELFGVMDSAAMQNSENEDGNYGPWKRFVTPKRKHASLRNVNLGDIQEDADLDLHSVSVLALSLILFWGEQADELTETLPVCSLLLSKASRSALHLHDAIASMNVANLNLILRLARNSDNILGIKSTTAILSARIVKMCLLQTLRMDENNYTCEERNAFRFALEGGNHIIFEVLLGILDMDASDDISEVSAKRMAHQILLATVMLETIAASVSSRPDLARTLLFGGDIQEDWRLVDKIVAWIAHTGRIMNHPSEGEGAAWDRIKLNFRCLLTCACLLVVSELWKSCRVTCSLTYNLESVHSCGIIAAYLTRLNKAVTTSLVANHIAELTRCSMLAMMKLDETNTLQDMSTSAINQRCILCDLLSRSLDILAIEVVSRVRTKSQGGIKFVQDLFDSGPMICWKHLSARDANVLAASLWLRVTRSAANWNVAFFKQANPPEEGMSSTSWCSFGSSLTVTNAVLIPGSNSIKTVIHSNAVNALCQSAASFSASWATFFEVVIANVIATRSNEEKNQITDAVAECTLDTIASLAESKMVAASQSSSQGIIEIGGTKPFGELSTLLMYCITAKKEFTYDHEERPSTKTMLDTIGRLYVAINNVFVMTQLGSVLPSEQVRLRSERAPQFYFLSNMILTSRDIFAADSNKNAVCSIRANLLTSALALVSDFESISQEKISLDNMMKYNDLRIGFTDLAVNTLQSLQYTQSETDNIAVSDLSGPVKYEYDFGVTSGSPLQLLRVCLSLLSVLTPTTIGSNPDDTTLFSYGLDFAACLKERNATPSLLRHLGAASNVSSLTYQSVQSGSSTRSVSIMHDNALDIVYSIVTIFHSLTDSGSAIVDVLLLLIENRCFSTLVDNPLLRTYGKQWMQNPSVESGSSIVHHRGYCVSIARSKHDITSSSSKIRPTSHNDIVHRIWREVINTFSSLIRSVRRQSHAHAKMDEHIVRQLNPVLNVAFDFICTYEGELFSCFSSMVTEARTQSSYVLGKGKTKSSSFSSSIQSSPFAFTPNLVKEADDISSLFAELCTGEVKISFSRQCRKIYERILSTSLDLTKIASSFLGSIANARELFRALSCVSIDMEPASMFDNPLLAEGVPNARHEAICNAHFAHSCCIIATSKDFANSHVATSTSQSTHTDSSLEQSFQIHVNNAFISEIEHVAGHCLLNSLSVLSDTHPTVDSFTFFSNEEATRFDVAAMVTPGTTIAIRMGNENQQRYLISSTEDTQYARAMSFDRSTRTISVEFHDSGVVDSQVPWSCIVGIEDTSKRRCIFEFGPSAKSIGEVEIRGPPSLGHLILTLKWCRHSVGSINLGSASTCSLHLTKCVADRAAVLLCTEVLTYDELRDKPFRDDSVIRQLNMQLLDLFDCTDGHESTHESKSLASLLGEETMSYIRKNLKSQLLEARLEREEEQQLWEQNHIGWGNASVWGSSTKREGRRSPFRGIRKSSSSGDFA